MTEDVMENENLVGDLGLDKVPEGVPDGAYPGYVVDAKFNPKVNRGGDKGPGRAFIFKYRIDQKEPVMYKGEPINVDGAPVDHFLPANKDDDLFLRQQLRDTFEIYGLDLTNVTQQNLKSIVGTPVWFKVKRNKKFVNVQDLKIRPEGDADPMSSVGQKSVDDF